MDREMGNKTEFETRNGRKWEMRRDKIHHLLTKNKKNREKTGKTGGKTPKLDGVGPVDSRPSTDKLHHFVRKKRRKKL